MGQYHLVINLDAREFLDPHELGVGLKAWEQLASRISTPHALFALLTCSNGRGGGDFRVRVSEASERVLGRWAGARIAVIGDYAEDDDFSRPTSHPISQLDKACRDGSYRDITALVRPVLAAELGVRFTAEYWWVQAADGSKTRHTRQLAPFSNRNRQAGPDSERPALPVPLRSSNRAWTQITHPVFRRIVRRSLCARGNARFLQ
jgi:hypothetical protein